MEGFLGGGYSWVRALHLISMVAWMAGMLYLPRLFVYHVEAAHSSQMSETFKTMERRLLRFIINPAMIATWVFGILLVLHLGAWRDPWMHAKFALLIGMQVVHAMLARYRRAFANDANVHGAKFYRVLNEVPTVLMILIVILASVKPF